MNSEAARNASGKSYIPLLENFKGTHHLEDLVYMGR
jgi:hypothetical protein